MIIQTNYKDALQLPIFEIISQAAQALNIEVYVIGGFVRVIVILGNIV